MAKEKQPQTDKKMLRKEIEHQLSTALGKLKEQLGNKGFNSRLKKAIKILTENMDTPKKAKSSATRKDSKSARTDKPARKEIKETAGQHNPGKKDDQAPKKKANKAPGKMKSEGKASK